MDVIREADRDHTVEEQHADVAPAAISQGVGAGGVGGHAERDGYTRTEEQERVAIDKEEESADQGQPECDERSAEHRLRGYPPRGDSALMPHTPIGVGSLLIIEVVVG